MYSMYTNNFYHGPIMADVQHQTCTHLCHCPNYRATGRCAAPNVLPTYIMVRIIGRLAAVLYQTYYSVISWSELSGDWQLCCTKRVTPIAIQRAESASSCQTIARFVSPTAGPFVEPFTNRAEPFVGPLTKKSGAVC